MSTNWQRYDVPTYVSMALRSIYPAYDELNYRILVTNDAELRKWRDRLDAFSSEHKEELVATMDALVAKKHEEEKRKEAKRSRKLWNRLCEEMPELNRLGIATVILTQKGGIEKEKSACFYGSQYDLEDEFETNCVVSFSIETEEPLKDLIRQYKEASEEGSEHEESSDGEDEGNVLISMSFYISVEMDLESDKVHFSEPKISHNVYFYGEAAENIVDIVKLIDAIKELFEEELYLPEDVFWDMDHSVRCYLGIQMTKPTVLGSIGKKRKTSPS